MAPVFRVPSLVFVAVLQGHCCCQESHVHANFDVAVTDLAVNRDPDVGLDEQSGADADGYGDSTYGEGDQERVVDSMSLSQCGTIAVQALVQQDGASHIKLAFKPSVAGITGLTWQMKEHPDAVGDWLNFSWIPNAHSHFVQVVTQIPGNYSACLHVGLDDGNCIPLCAQFSHKAPEKRHFQFMHSRANPVTSLDCFLALRAQAANVAQSCTLSKQECCQSPEKWKFGEPWRSCTWCGDGHIALPGGGSVEGINWGHFPFSDFLFLGEGIGENDALHIAVELVNFDGACSAFDAELKEFVNGKEVWTTGPFTIYPTALAELGVLLVGPGVKAPPSKLIKCLAASDYCGANGNCLP